MTTQDLSAYQKVIKEAMEKEREKAFLLKSIKIFKAKAEEVILCPQIFGPLNMCRKMPSIFFQHQVNPARLRSAFRAADFQFKGAISVDALTSILQENRGGAWNLKMKLEEAKVVAAELFHQQNLNIANDLMSYKQFLSAFSFQS